MLSCELLVRVDQEPLKHYYCYCSWLPITTPEAESLKSLPIAGDTMHPDTGPEVLELEVTWMPPFWGITFMMPESPRQAIRGKGPTVLRSYGTYCYVLKKNPHDIIIPRVQYWHAYVGHNQQLSNWTYLLNRRAIVSGTRNLASNTGLMKLWILKKNLPPPLTKTVIPNYILNICPYINRSV